MHGRYRPGVDVLQSTDSMPNDSSRRSSYCEPHRGYHRSTRSCSPPQPNLDLKPRTPASLNSPKNQRDQPNPPRNPGQGFPTAQVLMAGLPAPYASAALPTKSQNAIHPNYGMDPQPILIRPRKANPSIPKDSPYVPTGNAQGVVLQEPPHWSIL
ncbi:hypothetical protein AZE42_12010 [Rhizopogon vesiculosus]|uniref:Uncharacterized protein n=1 Tax=Rhizopogon vesiculosus TaxID=180088 RepID=A0A1J8QA93_9AGAM|nr:hypothetical protein AZE42_12010 [Rhizopogon vesiculosus]